MAAAAPFNAFAAAQSVKPISLEEAKASLREAMAVFEQPENFARLQQAKEMAGDDLMKMMMLVLPVGIDIQKEVIAKHGFTPDQMGVMQFLAAIKQHENDPEVAALAREMKSKLMPPQMEAMAAMFSGNLTPRS